MEDKAIDMFLHQLLDMESEAIERIPPFHGNTSDNTRCWECCIWSVLDYFGVHGVWTQDEVDELTGKAKGKWSWPAEGLVNLHKRGFDVRVFDEFDYRRFATEGRAYLQEWYGPKGAAQQDEFCDIPLEIERARRLVERNPIASGADLTTLRGLLSEGYLLILCVDWTKLNGKRGKIKPHFILVYGSDDRHFRYHDPGRPHKESQIISDDALRRAWRTTVQEKDENVIAIRWRERTS